MKFNDILYTEDRLDAIRKVAQNRELGLKNILSSLPGDEMVALKLLNGAKKRAEIKTGQFTKQNISDKYMDGFIELGLVKQQGDRYILTPKAKELINYVNSSTPSDDKRSGSMKLHQGRQQAEKALSISALRKDAEKNGWNFRSPHLYLSGLTDPKLVLDRLYDTFIGKSSKAYPDPKQIPYLVRKRILELGANDKPKLTPFGKKLIAAHKYAQDSSKSLYNTKKQQQFRDPKKL